MLAIAHMSTQKHNIIKDYLRHHSSFNPTTTLITLLYKNSYTVLVMLMLKEFRSIFAELTTQRLLTDRFQFLGKFKLINYDFICKLCGRFFFKNRRTTF